ncbi:hypothetical protein FGIG_01879 [Fasciola gigantica]|uniref:Uncharacterized protein n=1 Tax=Fasciola gigantica TaxID=46835 RepID=A0A504YVB8_FASGI|nr:hypothetical protein FGIG_01879 [Fasciola gigantica]
MIVQKQSPYNLCSKLCCCSRSDHCHSSRWKVFMTNTTVSFSIPEQFAKSTFTPDPLSLPDQVGCWTCMTKYYDEDEVNKCGHLRTMLQSIARKLNEFSTIKERKLTAIPSTIV